MTLERMGIFLLLFSLSLGLTWLVRIAGFRLDFVAQPRADRWHQKPRTLLGGAAIYASFLIGYLAFVPKTPGTLLLIAGGSGMFVLGLLDDLRQVGPQTKLVVQIGISVALILSGVTLQFSDSDVLNFGITLLWLVGITNAMNLLDNMDGLCAGVALIATGFRVLFCAIENDWSGFLVALVFLAVLAGYLAHNFPPASIFMGDSGSLFIGFMLAGMTAGSHPYTKNIASVLLFPLLILIIPIFDTTLVTLARKFSGRSISVGGLDHSSHRLVATGLSERNAVLILYSITLIAGGIAFLQYQTGFSLAILFISLFLMALTLFGVYLSKIEVYDSLDQVGSDRKDFFQLVADIPHKRYAFFIVLDAFIILTAYYGAYRLRFEGFELEEQSQNLMQPIPLVLIISTVTFLLSGLYHQSWRYTGLRDLLSMVKAIGGSVIVTVIAVTYFYRFEGYSRSVFVIFGACC